MGILRSIPLPGPVDSGARETKYEDGVLTVILPKENEKPRWSGPPVGHRRTGALFERNLLTSMGW